MVGARLQFFSTSCSSSCCPSIESAYVGVAEHGSKRGSPRWKEVGCRKTRGKLGASQCIGGMCSPEAAR
ncbi:hypothetical protein BDL97_11G115800 [Sphagnum fallax]|nr:hypothetical protein BDL97_11G115800 [Sphagnum fallax]